MGGLGTPLGFFKVVVSTFCKNKKDAPISHYIRHFFISMEKNQKQRSYDHFWASPPEF